MQAGDVSPYLRTTIFSAFLAKIGPAHAAQITRLTFHFVSCDELTLLLPLVTELGRKYLLALHFVYIYVEDRDFPHTRDYDDSSCWEDERRSHPNLSSPHWTNGNFQAMYDALDDFVETITWLEELMLTGMGIYEDNKEWWQLLKGLQETVKERYEASIRKGNSHRLPIEDVVIDDGPVMLDDDSDAETKEEVENNIDDLLAVMGWINFL